MSQPIKNYSDSDLQHLFDNDTWQAALELHKAAAVSDLLFVRDGAVITAQVTSHSNEVCSVDIEIDGQHVDGDCNCRHGANCEHVAAALLKARQPPHGSPTPQRKLRRRNIARKTVQALAFLSCCKIGKSDHLGVLIVVPTSLLGNFPKKLKSSREANSLRSNAICTNP